MTTATIMIATSSTIPTAVSTESSEKTMSSRRIWMRTPPNDAVFALRRGVMGRLAFEGFVDLGRGLPEQEQAAAYQDQVAPRQVPPEQADDDLGQARRSRRS